MRQRRGIGRLLAPALLLLLGGCALFDRPDPKRPDPLTGLPKRVPPSDRAVSSTYNPAEQTRAGVLATSGQKPPSEGTSGLSIRDGKPSDASGSTQQTGAWSGKESRTTPTSTDAGRPAAAPSGSDGNGGVRVRTFEEAQQFLAARGVKWQDLKNTGESEWVFACSIPTKNSTSVRTYEARDRYGLLAMQKVIDQILREQQGH
jgi:hypothetical protein